MKGSRFAIRPIRLSAFPAIRLSRAQDYLPRLRRRQLEPLEMRERYPVGKAVGVSDTDLARQKDQVTHVSAFLNSYHSNELEQSPLADSFSVLGVPFLFGRAVYRKDVIEQLQ